jgi:hypothetical protein
MSIEAVRDFVDGKDSFVKLIEEDISSRLDLENKADLLLVHKKVKPAAIITFSYGININSVEEMLRDDMKSTKKALSISGLPYCSQRNLDEEEGYVGIRFFIGKNKQSLRELLAEHRENNVGLALGYPKTAVEAFNKGIEHKADLFALPRDIFAFYMNFRFFVLSQSHWQEEMKLIRNWASVIEGTAPKLYKKMLSVNNC